ncbi:hypothetical protein PRUPE_1G174200 [Prunus persica]|uniref:Uncharacterized protein n=1 Tax=Prunus persica TaxID=3760 RepID=A0A251QZ44_PRUPE|nr:hypothetical protein PRUPE_1G174200 [Prunus persica]
MGELIKYTVRRSEVYKYKDPKVRIFFFFALLHWAFSSTASPPSPWRFYSYEHQTQKNRVLGFLFWAADVSVEWPEDKSKMQQNLIWGWFFIASGSVFFLGFLYATVLSKLLPPSDNIILSAIQNDRLL